ncbi:MAG: class I SAM-dependent methyltransferase [Bacteroidota bacterium]
MKDNFSLQSNQYARFRPSYPDEVFEFLLSRIPGKQHAWDCGTGNGQVAKKLSQYFERLFATDISQAQIDNAHHEDNIEYSIQPAEHTDFQNRFFDLVTVGQAVHWFDFERFYKEVYRTAREGALICILGYGKIEISPAIDEVINDFYHHVIGKYWDKERRYIDEQYRTIPFPFEEISVPQFDNVHHWDFKHLIGYINTWSAVKHFIRQNGKNPVDKLETRLKPLWTTETKVVKFPVLIRVGIIRHKEQ